MLDAAFGMTAHGKIRSTPEREPIPEAGPPMPMATHDRRRGRLDGLILPAGGHKGIGIGIMVGLLSTLLADAGYGRESGNMEDGAYVGRDGQFAMAIRIDAFRPAAGVKAHVDRIAREIRDSQKRPGVKALYPPGGLEAALQAAYRRDGIPLNDITLAGIADAAKALGVTLDLARPQSQPGGSVAS